MTPETDWKAICERDEAADQLAYLRSHLGAAWSPRRTILALRVLAIVSAAGAGVALAMIWMAL